MDLYCQEEFSPLMAKLTSILSEEQHTDYYAEYPDNAAHCLSQGKTLDRGPHPLFKGEESDEYEWIALPEEDLWKWWHALRRHAALGISTEERCPSSYCGVCHCGLPSLLDDLGDSSDLSAVGEELSASGDSTDEDPFAPPDVVVGCALAVLKEE